MEPIDSYYYILFYFSVFFALLAIAYKFIFLFNARKLTNREKGLKNRFPIPNLIIYTIASVLLISSLVFGYLALFQTKANEAELSESQNSVDILFLVDVSLSMNATDVASSRLKRVQDILIRIAPELSGNRVGLLVFAGGAFSFCPMTSDISAFSDYVNALGVDMVGRKGTDLSKSIGKANEILSSGKVLKNRIAVIISDGEDHETLVYPKIEAAVQVWGIGTQEGGTIYFGDENSKSSGFVTKSGGLTTDEKSEDVIISTIDETRLKTLAEDNSGEYYNISYESLGAYRLLDKIADMKKNQIVLLQKIRKEEGASVFLILSVLFLFSERFLRFFYFAKRILLLVFLLSFGYSSDLSAWELDPGGNRVEEGVKLFEEKKFQESDAKFKEAEPYFSDDSRLKFNQADSDFQLGKYKDAIEKNNAVIEDPKIGKETKAKALYNNGNAYFKLKDLKSAQKFYEETLSVNPDHEGAKKNLELLHKKQNSPNQKSSENQSDQTKKRNLSPSEKKENPQQSKNKETEKENADRMMENFSPDSILRKKSNEGGNRDNDKFW
ncbi:VWA domain-containing protein [Leptospira ognonensis]|uniref:VWA domain-containing protein n=1 Tax=Leptospira ognonensis TaxID=2484945 RepID=A0A4R9K6F0_9LEPT|nr:VWA domain-containing protein [Leptospira ognonensis]TGL61835.1 VWA domain-containing protein [Leptospira ognonensis]